MMNAGTTIFSDAYPKPLALSVCCTNIHRKKIKTYTTLPHPW